MSVPCWGVKHSIMHVNALSINYSPAVIAVFVSPHVRHLLEFIFQRSSLSMSPNVQLYPDRARTTSMQVHMLRLNASMAVVHIDRTHTGTHCASNCMDSCRFIPTVGRSADLRMDVYGDLLVF